LLAILSSLYEEFSVPVQTKSVGSQYMTVGAGIRLCTSLNSYLFSIVSNTAECGGLLGNP